MLMLLVRGSHLRATAIGDGSFLKEGNKGRKGIGVTTTPLGPERKGRGRENSLVQWGAVCGDRRELDKMGMVILGTGFLSVPATCSRCPGRCPRARPGWSVSCFSLD